MIIDPHVAVIRVAKDVGPDLYEGVMRRVAERHEQPRGVMLHYSATWLDSFFVGTVFRDSASMLEGFVGYSAPEAQNEMVATGRTSDMSRHEFQLERLLVEPSVEPLPFANVPADGIIAFTAEALLPSIETYREIARRPGYFDQPAEGRIAHIAHHSPVGVRLMTFWRSREAGERWNEEHLYGPLRELEPGKLTDDTIEASWLELNSFVVCVAKDDPTRNFVRDSAGPSNT
jgi:hypothetical protein